MLSSDVTQDSLKKIIDLITRVKFRVIIAKYVKTKSVLIVKYVLILSHKKASIDIFIYCNNIYSVCNYAFIACRKAGLYLADTKLFGSYVLRRLTSNLKVSFLVFTT